MKTPSGANPIDILTLHHAFSQDRTAAESMYLGRELTVTATVLRTGTSMYSTPIIEASDSLDGDVLAILVLPFGREAEASFQLLETVRRGQQLLVAGECRLYDEQNAVIVFKESAIVNW